MKMQLEKLDSNKQGKVDFRNTTLKVTLIIVGVIVILSLFEAMIPEVQSAGNSMNDSNRCATVGCHYNDTVSNPCRNSTGNTSTTMSCQQSASSIPLASLFSGTGFVVLLLMVLLFLVIMNMVMRKKGK